MKLEQKVTAFNNVNHQETRDLKIQALANTNLASNLDNIYSKWRNKNDNKRKY